LEAEHSAVARIEAHDADPSWWYFYDEAFF